MGSVCRRVSGIAVAAFFFAIIGGCGGHRPPGISTFPAKVTLNPGSGTSLQLGGIIGFTATAQNSSGGNVNAAFSYTSSDTSILNFAPGGFACAGVWNPTYTVCTPGAAGPVEVTATASGQTSAPALIFVHPPVDTITVSGFELTGIPPQEPCLSQGGVMTVQAHAYSQGIDITSSVGTFNWAANNPSVVKITPIVSNYTFSNFTYNVTLNQATLTAVNPGMTQIFATASGVNSTSFLQTPYTNSQGASPPLDFFETCNIQSITLQVGPAGTNLPGLTTFVASKGTAENATAILTDIAGMTSLPNTNGGTVLSKIPLTWTASQPTVISTAAGCTITCGISTPSVGSGTVTTSCSPPTCNIGYPLIPPSLSTNGQLDPTKINACTQFFAPNFPSNPNFSCAQLIPYPVYASAPLPAPAPQTGAISGLVTGTTGTSSALATSTGCDSILPETCTTGLYSLSTNKAVPGGVNIMPVSPNSLLFDLAGDKAYIGSEFGAELLNPSSLGTNNNAFTSLGSVTGQVLAVSNNGSLSVFADTVHTPNQVYIVNATNANSLSAAAFNINQASAAAFTPDGQEAYILSNNGNALYIYSTLQALQGPFTLTGRASTPVPSPNGGFLFLPESSLNGSTPNLTAYSVCNNSIATSTPATGSLPAVVNLPANPLFVRVLPGVHIDGTDSQGNPIPDGMHIFILDSTGFDILTASTTPALGGTLCPQNLTFITGGTSLVQRIELGQGTLQPVNFFASADGSLLYVLNNSSSRVMVYSFATAGVTGIPLQNDAVPISADITLDSGTILAGASDGMVHLISTAIGGGDLLQVSFPDLPDYLNPFCTYAPNQVPCTLNVLAVRP
jgi:hypothetical protein